MKKSLLCTMLCAGVIVGLGSQAVHAGDRPAKTNWRSFFQPFEEGYDDAYAKDDDWTTKSHKTVRGKQNWIGQRGASVLVIIAWFLHEWEKVKDPYFEKHPELVTEGMGRFEKLKMSYGIMEIWKAFFARNFHNLTLGVMGEKGSTSALSVIMTYAAFFNGANQVNQYKLHGLCGKKKKDA